MIKLLGDRNNTHLLPENSKNIDQANKPRLDIKLLKAVFDHYVKKPRDLYHFDPVREILLNILHRNRLDNMTPINSRKVLHYLGYHK